MHVYMLSVKTQYILINLSLHAGNHEVYRIQAQNENEKELWMKNISACIHRSPVIDLLQQRRQAASVSSKSSQTIAL